MRIGIDRLYRRVKILSKAIEVNSRRGVFNPLDVEFFMLDREISMLLLRINRVWQVNRNMKYVYLFSELRKIWRELNSKWKRAKSDEAKKKVLREIREKFIPFKNLLKKVPELMGVKYFGNGRLGRVNSL